MLAARFTDRPRPEWAVLRRNTPGWQGAITPRPDKHCRLHQHGHVTSHPIATLGHALEFSQHRGPRGGVAIIQLQSIWPAIEVRITSVGQDLFSPGSLQSHVVPRFPAQILVRALDEILRIALHPGMIRRDMVRHKIQNETKLALGQASSQAGQRRVVAEILVHRVGLDREWRTANVLVGHVRQAMLAGRAQGRLSARDLAPNLARLPDSEEPNPIETFRCDPIQQFVWNIIQRRGPANLNSPFLEENPCVDLIKKWVSHKILVNQTLLSSCPCKQTILTPSWTIG